MQKHEWSLEIIMLNNVSQAQKDKYHLFSYEKATGLLRAKYGN